MNFQTLTITSLQIERFKKIRSLEIEPDQGANLFFGSYRSGKTSLCEFIQFILYGVDSVSLARGNEEDAIGSILFSADEKNFRVERSVIAGKENLQFIETETGKEVETDLTPGEYLTGLNQQSFDFITYFKQARYQTPNFKLSPFFLETIASLSLQTKNIYGKKTDLDRQMLLYKNSQKNGKLDLLLSEKEALEAEIAERPNLEEKLASCTAAFTEVSAKLDENDRRCVLLKADMASHTDDFKLNRNKENAQDLHKRIVANEKKLRVMNYEVANKIGKLEPEELEEMKTDYNRLSVAVTNLSEARLSLTSAQENLAFHEKIFKGTAPAEEYEADKKRITKFKLFRMVLRILGVILLASGACLTILLHHFGFSMPISVSSGASLAALAIALFPFSSIFTSKINKILAARDKDNFDAFNEFLDRLHAHAKTTQVYRDQVDAAEKNCFEKNEAKETVQARIFQKIKHLGYTEEDGELLAICDDIIEANDSLYELQNLIEEEKETYRQLLSANVESKTLTVSSEFLALQQELAFLTAQNDALYKKKALLFANRKSIEDSLNKDPEEIQAALQETMEKLQEVEAEYEALNLNRALIVSAKEKFEQELKDFLIEKINSKLAFMLKAEESYLFDETFELCFCDRKSILPLVSAGGGMVSEMGLLAFRLSLAELLNKNTLPMIFDDSLSLAAPEMAEALYEVLQKSCQQFFIATSSRDILSLCQNSAKVIRLP